MSRKYSLEYIVRRTEGDDFESQCFQPPFSCQLAVEGDVFPSVLCLASLGPQQEQDLGAFPTAPVSLLPKVSVTSPRKWSCLKQQNWNLSQFCRLQVLKERVRRARHSPSQGSAEDPFLDLSCFSWLWVILGVPLLLAASCHHHMAFFSLCVCIQIFL